MSVFLVKNPKTRGGGANYISAPRPGFSLNGSGHKVLINDLRFLPYEIFATNNLDTEYLRATNSRASLCAEYPEGKQQGSSLGAPSYCAVPD